MIDSENEKSRQGSGAQFFINFNTYEFSMKTKQQKTFSRGSLCPPKKTFKFEFFGSFYFIFFANIVKI